MLFESDTLQLQVSYGIAELRFLAPLTWRDVIADLNSALDLVDQRRNIDVLVVREFASLPRRHDATSICRDGQRLTERIASLAIPSIAYIDGRCRGPALELAIACTRRTASGQMATRFGADGIACWGGTARLPRLIGRTSALALLAGTAILTARQAYDIGLMDRVWSPRFAEVGLLDFTLNLQRHPSRPSNFNRRWRRLQTGSLPAPTLIETWLLRAVDRGLRYGLGEAMVIERAAAQAVQASQSTVVRNAA